ncbi:MAG: hypothetical protein K0A94_07505 [Desulfuromonadales bacterium]|nr:hypothetical protein [Desulfuromonadales bacterium]
MSINKKADTKKIKYLFSSHVAWDRSYQDKGVCRHGRRQSNGHGRRKVSLDVITLIPAEQIEK